MRRPIRVVETYGVNVTNFLSGEDSVFKFDVQIFFDDNLNSYVLEFSPLCFFVFKSKQALLNVKKRRIQQWLENKCTSSLLYYSNSFELIETRFIYNKEYALA